MGYPSKLALLLAAGLTTPSTPAQDAATIADVRCIVVGMRLSADSSTAQSEGIILSWYFIGRLDGREPKLDLEKFLSEEFARMSSADVATEERRCKRLLDIRGQEVTNMGEAAMRPEK